MEHPALKFKKDKNWVRIRQKTFSAPGGGRMNNVEWLGERSRRKEKERKKREKWAGVMKRWGRLWESKSPLLKLTRKPVAVGTASSTVTQVFSTRQFKKIFAHAPFFTFSSWKNQVKQNADLLDYSFPFISQKLSFHFVCCVQPRSWRIFVGGRSKCRLEKKINLHRVLYTSFHNILQWHGVCLDLTSLPSDYHQLRGQLNKTSTNGRR